MAKTPLINKLRIQPRQRLLIIDAPEDYIDLLGDLPAGVEVVERPAGTFGFVQLFVKTLADLRSKSKAAFEAVKYDGLLWVSYPKKTSKLDSDLSRDVIWAEVAESGWRPVAQVSVNEVWSAMRLRPAETVGK